MMKNANHKKTIISILRLLRHGDQLLMHEIAEHIDVSKYTTTQIVQNYRDCFIIYGSASGPGSGRGIKRRYGISLEGKYRLRQANEEDVSVDWSRPPIFREHPLLFFLHSKIFRPYKELGNTGGQFAKQGHHSEVQG